MRTGWRTLLVLITLMLWVVSGPIGMAFDGCAMMGAMCEAPCGASSCVIAPVVTDLASLQPLAYLEPSREQQPALGDARPLTPPPKSPLLSA